MGILQLISTNNFITLNKDLIKLLGLEEAILIGELASESNYWENQNKLENGYFYSTVENIENNTTLSDHKQRKALKNLKDKRLIEIKVKGMPAKRYIKINEEQVLKLFNLQFLKNSRTSSEKIKEQDIKNFKTNNNINNNNNKNNNINNNKKEKFGTYGRIKLTKEEYERLIKEFGSNFIKNQIELLDEYVESNNNKNRYTNFNLVLRKSIREKWFNKSIKEVPDWFNKEIKENISSEEEQKEIEQIIESVTK